MAASTFAGRRRAARSEIISQVFPFVSLLLFAFVILFHPRDYSYSSPAGLMTQQFDLSTDGASRRAAIDGVLREIPGSSDPDQDVLLPSTPMKPDLHTQATFMTLRIVTYNIRYATEHPVAGERHWDVRCPKLGAQLSFLSSGHENAFLCLQEGLYSQLQDIQAQLGDAWSYIGQGRDDGDKAGEHSPIFYRSQFWNCERTETRWLSETPTKPSRGWDASQNRIVTIGEFSHKMTGTRVVIMSTHFDDAGAKARQASAKLLISFANEWDRGHGQRDRPSVVLVAGDLNSTPDGGAYQTMTELGSGMFDISELVPESKRYGNYLTYTTFGEAGELPQRLDYLFIKEPRTAVVKSFGVLANSFDDQIRVSDHRPVVADMEITL